MIGVRKQGKGAVAGMQVNAQSMIGDILDYDEDCNRVFKAFEMPCDQCPSARGETVEEACQVHGVSLPVLLEKLNAVLKHK